MTAASPACNLLIVSARPGLGNAIGQALRAAGHDALVEPTGPGASASLATSGVDAVLVDLDLPGLDLHELRQAIAPGASAAPEPLESVERRHIVATLRYTKGNRRNAANLLGIARSTLLAKIRRYGLDRGQLALEA